MINSAKPHMLPREQIMEKSTEVQVCITDVKAQGILMSREWTIQHGKSCFTRTKFFPTYPEAI